jgi:hypothetical protein
MDGGEGERRRPEGTQLHFGRHGPQRVETRGWRWSDEAETLFLDHLAATANVTASSAACGFSPQALYARRRKDAAFQQRWDVALAQGYAHIEALLVQRAIEALEGFAPDPQTPLVIRDMTVKDALILLGHHRRTMEGLPRSRRKPWEREVPIEEVRQEILRKVEAIERVKRAQAGRDWAAALGSEQHQARAARELVQAYRGNEGER